MIWRRRKKKLGLDCNKTSIRLTPGWYLFLPSPKITDIVLIIGFEVKYLELSKGSRFKINGKLAGRMISLGSNWSEHNRLKQGG